MDARPGCLVFLLTLLVIVGSYFIAAPMVGPVEVFGQPVDGPVEVFAQPIVIEPSASPD